MGIGKGNTAKSLLFILMYFIKYFIYRKEKRFQIIKTISYKFKSGTFKKAFREVFRGYWHLQFDLLLVPSPPPLQKILSVQPPFIFLKGDRSHFLANKRNFYRFQQTLTGLGSLETDFEGLTRSLCFACALTAKINQYFWPHEKCTSES